MEGKGLVYGGGDSINQTQKRKISSHEQSLDSMFTSASSNSFVGSRTMVSFGALNGLKRPGNLLFGSFNQEESGDEYLDEYYNQPEKKKRLTVDQVKFLEKSFELENKLEPERKIQLAKELSLQPRQIAVWFQNRRARWKTKQLETKYETLHASYNSLKTGYDNLVKENQKLKTEVLHLKGNKLVGDFDNVSSELHANGEALPEITPSHDDVSENEEFKIQKVEWKLEEQSSDKSDVTNADSPHFTDGIHSSCLESGETSHIFEPHQIELLPTEENNLNEEFFLSSIFPKMEDAFSYLPASSCSYGFPLEDHSFNFWSC